LPLPGVIHVLDREGDILEVLNELDRTHQSFVIRARHDRILEDDTSKLFETVRQGPELGRFQLRVPRRSRGREGAATNERVADLCLRSASVILRPPPGLRSKYPNLEVGIVQIVESHPPDGIEPIEWFLLTREPHSDFDQCRRIADIYAKRWKIEEFHMAIKTGCRIEERQLQSRGAIESFLALADVIAVTLLRLRHLARSSEPTLASLVLSERQLTILRRRFPHLAVHPSSREALRAVAQLGGFLGRTRDGEPGWRTIWSGMHDLWLMEFGFILAEAAATAPSTATCG
jgi:hypothetical protein